ncbi:ParB/Srx family N-terminal domain-containing protein [Methylorubrum extorquens]|uniref:ParB/Srx family N-terminal domain-containing protein n=1 Tax=Methylorubrum extorquens TaxID=408 RepID=UPI0002E51985|nr:ParB/Srx family N-terminal domain-containing protein [Methylorubrum extorquens]
MPKQPRSRRSSTSAAANPTVPNTFLAETIELVPSDSLTAYARDLRQHSDKQVAQIAASLRAFGFLVPLIAAADNTIVAGHGRWLAAKHLGLPRLPVIRAGHLSPERLRAFRLADNRLAENAGWNREALAMELSELTGLELDFELELTGFETAEIDLILDPPTAKAATDPADACPLLAAGPAVTQLGDLWQLGPHRLLCGSALEADSYATLLQGESVRMVFSDPPYNVPVSGHVCGSGRPEYPAGNAVPPLQRRTGDGAGGARGGLPILQPLREIAGQDSSIAQGGIHDGHPLQEIFARHAKPPMVETDRPRRRETSR